MDRVPSSGTTTGSRLKDLTGAYYFLLWMRFMAAIPSFFLPFFFVYAQGILLFGDSVLSIAGEITGCVLFFAGMAVVSNDISQLPEVPGTCSPVSSPLL